MDYLNKRPCRMNILPMFALSINSNMIIFHDEFSGNITPQSTLKKQNTMEFISNKIKADVHGMKEYFAAKEENWLDWEVIESDVRVDWTADFIQRDWGIASLTAYATKVVGKIILSRAKENKGLEYSEETIEEKIELNVIPSMDKNAEWKIKDDIKPFLNGELMSVTQVSVDLHTKEIFIG